MGFFDKLKAGLGKTKNAVFGQINNLIKSFARVDEEKKLAEFEAIRQAQIAEAKAAEKAMEQDVKGGKAAIKVSYTLRLIVMAVLLLVFAKSGHCNALAMVCPLVLVFPILTVIEFFRKAGGKQHGN